MVQRMFRLRYALPISVQELRVSVAADVRDYNEKPGVKKIRGDWKEDRLEFFPTPESFLPVKDIPADAAGCTFVARLMNPTTKRLVRQAEEEEQRKQQEREEDEEPLAAPPAKRPRRGSAAAASSAAAAASAAASVGASAAAASAAPDAVPGASGRLPGPSGAAPPAAGPPEDSAPPEVGRRESKELDEERFIADAQEGGMTTIEQFLRGREMIDTFKKRRFANPAKKGRLDVQLEILRGAVKTFRDSNTGVVKRHLESEMNTARAKFEDSHKKLAKAMELLTEGTEGHAQAFAQSEAACQLAGGDD